MQKLLAIALFASAVCYAQTSSLSGTITDNTGAVIPNVTVKLNNNLTNESFTGISSSSGVFNVPLLKPGTYELRIEQAGFKQFRQTGIVIETGVPSNVDVRLEVGGVTEQITVEADAPLLKTESSSVGNVVRRDTIANMPLVGRRAASLARLSGFLVQNGTGSNFTMAGGRGDNTNFTIDGGNAQNILLGVATLNFDPPIDALEEFNVEVSNFKAELGRSGGGVVQMTTRSGTNNWHGSLYEFLRNDRLDARNFFAARKPILRYNQFGGSFSGPAIKNRTFFFFNTEWVKTRSQATRLLSIPDAAEIAGQFPRVITDPLANFAPFSGNLIPTSRMDPVGRAIAQYYPTPNVAGAASRVNNFRVNNPTGTNTNVIVTRVDHTFSSNDRIYFRFLRNQSPSFQQPIFRDNTDQYGETIDNFYYSLAPTWIHSFSPTTILEARYSYDRRKFQPITASKGLGIPERIGLRGTNALYFPRVTLTGLEPFGRGEQERIQFPIEGHHYTGSVTKVTGNHTLKFGLEYRKSRNDDTPLGSAGGNFNFTPVGTNDALASLLLGHVANASRDESGSIVSNGATVGTFAQTDWKVRPTLTLNLGVRWDLDVPRYETNNKQNSFDRNAINPVCNCPGVITFSGRDGLSKYASGFDYNNFGPRVGFAWRPRDKWVIRGGGAILFIGQYDQATPLAVRGGFSTAVSVTSVDGGRTAPIQLRAGLPPTVSNTLSPGFGAVPIGTNPIFSAEFFDPGKRRIPYMETFNFNIQRLLPANMLFEIGYIATLGHKLTFPGTVTINQVDPAIIRPGNVQALRPFPQFSDVREHSPTIGNSNYHGMNVRLEKRYSRGLQFGINYTWSKLIDDINSRNELGAAPSISNFYNRRADRGLSANHVGHRLIGNTVWEVPIGNGKAVNISNPVLNAIAGGWSTGLILEFRTGVPFSIQENNAAAIFPTAAAVRSNATGPYAENPNWRANVLGQSFFVRETFVAPPPLTFGTLGRSLAIGPGAFIGDLSVLKDFSMPWEGHKLQFRWESLNFANHANFASPVTGRGNPNFGRITG
ncbi:MAG: TonB-dependent receptor, partial [Bryobacteraceae bacterium]|nr:TonB-dependent receptor [Bryobacteraceae bacterium]